MENEGKKRALIIGVSHYKHADPLNFCSNDGNKMHELLKSIGYEVSEKNGLIGSVSWDMMRETLINFFNSDKIKSNDTLLFYYSGHGIPDIDGEVYLATSEIDPSIPYKRGFSFDELAKIMQRSPSRRIVSILDCCYSGSAKLGKGHEDDAAKLGMAGIDRGSAILKNSEGRFLLASSQSYQEAFALEEENHSLFTYYLLQWLRGKAADEDGYVTADELLKYVSNTIIDLPPEKSPKQMPLRRVEASGDIVLAYYPSLANALAVDRRTGSTKKIKSSNVALQEEGQFRHIDYPLVAKEWLSAPMYNLHKYWARKPPNLVAEYIQNYTKPNDVVMDPDDFEKDLIKMLGGAGREDFLVTPYLNDGFNRYGDRISVERKSGKQKYTGEHFEEAVRHSIERGATYSIIAYDTQDNLPQKPMITREKDVLVAVVEIESGTWKMARVLFEELQKEMAFKKRTVNEINIQAIQEVATDIGGLLVYMSNIHGKTTKIQNLIEKHKKDIDEDLDEIKAAVGRHQKKLMAAVSGLANGEMETGVAPQQVKPVRIR